VPVRAVELITPTSCFIKQKLYIIDLFMLL
jgi:hypothetical protein